MKNAHIKLIALVVLLVAGSAYVIATKPTSMGLDIQGGMRVVLRAKTEELPRGAVWNSERHETTVGIIRNRIQGIGVGEQVIYPKGSDQIVVELPGIEDKEAARAAIQTTAKLEFRNVRQLESGGSWRAEDETNERGEETGFQKIVGSDGKDISPDELDDRIFKDDNTLILSGEDLLPNCKAELTPDGTVVHFEFKNDKKGIFEDYTRSHVGKPLAIFLDKKLISAPNIEGVIPGKGIIRGNFTAAQAKTLAGQLNAGALPVPLETLSETNVEATLGDAAVKQALLAGIVGLGVVLLFMMVTYRIPGVLANLALILYTVFTFALFKLIPVTLTVPGIAGFILSIGMAVDANILIFERMKEERLSGKTIRAAIEAGFKRAFTAIFDSNVCTLITCAILYQFGTGPVKGFALTLAVGVAVSMFTAITCSRSFLLLLAGTGFGQNDRIYPLGKGLHPKLGVTKRMGFWFGLSGLIVVPGLVFWLGLDGIKRSIEFTGGTEITATYASRPSIPEIQNVLRQNGHEESRVLLGQGNLAVITTKQMPQAELEKVSEALKAGGATIQGSASVGGAISRELTANAFYSILWASVLIVVYLSVRFAIPSFVEGLKFGFCAIAALLHDVLVVWGLFAIFGYTMNWQIDSLFVTAMLTVIGFSVHDTIIIFDRIRENLRLKARGETFADVTDRSIEQTFSRSVYTSGTVVITLLALLIFGGPVIRVFVTALLIGIISGTYSSIFNASPLLVLWKLRAGDRAVPATATSGGGSRPAPRAFQAPEPRLPAPSASSAGGSSPIARAMKTEGEAETVSGAKSRKKKRRM